MNGIKFDVLIFQLLKDLIERKMNHTETNDPIAMGRCVSVCGGRGISVYVRQVHMFGYFVSA